MRWLKLNETQARMIVGALKGAGPGGAAGAAASLATGAAVVATAPVWIPIVGGTAAVSFAAVTACSAIGAGLGAASGATLAYFKQRRTDRSFREAGFQLPEEPKED